MSSSSDPRDITNPNVEVYTDEMVDWVMEHLTVGQRAVACSNLLAQLQDQMNTLSDLRLQLVLEMRAGGPDRPGMGLQKIADVLGVAKPTVVRLVQKDGVQRKPGGYANNKRARDNRWNAIRREYGQTAEEREANGFEADARRSAAGSWDRSRNDVGAPQDG